MTPDVRAAQNAERQYAVWAGIALRNQMAIPNPDFDPTRPMDEMIFWTPDGLRRLLSMDETDVRTDQTKRGHSAGQRSVRAQAAGCGQPPWALRRLQGAWRHAKGGLGHRLR